MFRKQFLLQPLWLIICCLTQVSGQQKGLSPISSDLSSVNNTYAVLVGISDYQDESIPDLKYADSDVKAFESYLKSPAGGKIKKENIRTLLNDQATMAQFAMALDWLWEVAQENDQVIIYFSGHGDVEKKSFTQTGFLLCWDAPSHVYMAGGCFALQMLQEVITTLSVQNKAKVLVITDACRSGKLSGNSVNGTQLTSGNLAKQFSNETKILSCQPNEYSLEGEQWGGGRGAFSFHLLEGLIGYADNNNDKIVSLKEISRYLEDTVPEEVAPQNQNPMVIGDKTEKISFVSENALTQLKQSKKGQLKVMNQVDQKGIEDQVLSELDSTLLKKYEQFKIALKEKRFLESDDLSAESLYSELSKNQALSKLHGAMKRSYSAALQDEAQQVLNTMLKSGLTEQILKQSSAQNLYGDYPAYLKRAATLLGPEHYMYDIILARRKYFQAKLEKERISKRRLLHEAIKFQKDLAHAHVEFISTFNAEEIDSAQYYFELAKEMVPSWVEPYIAFAAYHGVETKDTLQEEKLLEEAGRLDSLSVLVMYNKANYHLKQKNFEEAEFWLKKTVAFTGDEVCFPCAHLNLSMIYSNQLKREASLAEADKALALDSTFARAYVMKGVLNAQLNKADESASNYRKAIALDSTLTNPHFNLAIYHARKRESDKAIELLKRTLQIDSNYVQAYSVLGVMEQRAKNYDEALKYHNKVAELKEDYTPTYINLGSIYKELGQIEKSEQAYYKAISIKDYVARPHAYIGLGQLYESENRFEDSEQAYLDAIASDSLCFPAHFNITKLYYAIDKVDAASKHLSISKHLNPKEPSLNLWETYLNVKAGKIEDAWHTLELSLKSGGAEINDIKEDTKLTEMKSDPRWESLLLKYAKE